VLHKTIPVEPLTVASVKVQVLAVCPIVQELVAA
jgi:hypothetical protein